MREDYVTCTNCLHLIPKELWRRACPYCKAKDDLLTGKIEFENKKFTLFVGGFLTIFSFVWAILLHLSNVDKYYQATIFGWTVLNYLMFQYELHRK